MLTEKKNVIKEKSYELALQIIQLTKLLPRRTEGFVIGNQIMKSGTSIGANVEEALAAFSKDDFRYKMSVALEEARETYYWLFLLRDAEILAKNNLTNVLYLTTEVMKILGAIVKSSQTK